MSSSLTVSLLNPAGSVLAWVRVVLSKVTKESKALTVTEWEQCPLETQCAASAGTQVFRNRAKDRGVGGFRCKAKW